MSQATPALSAEDHLPLHTVVTAYQQQCDHVHYAVLQLIAAPGIAIGGFVALLGAPAATSAWNAVAVCSFICALHCFTWFACLWNAHRALQGHRQYQAALQETYAWVQAHPARRKIVQAFLEDKSYRIRRIFQYFPAEDDEC